jgi:hypothetical protein
MKHLR